MTISIFGTGIIDSEDARITLANTALLIPTGNTAQRPSSAVTGMLRFNTQTVRYEAYNGIEWANISSPYVPPTYTLEYLVVAGGGGGGTPNGSGGGGGGGAGGLLTSNLSVNTFPIVYTVTVGAGGSADTVGSNSSIISQQGPNVSITSFGGGKGGGQPHLNAGSGGSGGGAAGQGNSGNGTPGQGNNGGASDTYTGGGGGGASQVGFIGSAPNRATGGKGGDGRPSLITGANVIYAGGGGGGCNSDGAVPRSVGGAGGGGYGSGFPTEVGGSGNVNLGGGGGAGSRGPETAGGTGGSGVVIIAHSNTLSNGIVSAGLTYTTNTTSRPGFIVYRFTAGTGTISWS